MHAFSRIEFKSPENLVNACNAIKHCILKDPSLPVNVEACIALQELLNDEENDMNTTTGECCFDTFTTRRYELWN